MFLSSPAGRAFSKYLVETPGTQEAGKKETQRWEAGNQVTGVLIGFFFPLVVLQQKHTHRSQTQTHQKIKDKIMHRLASERNHVHRLPPASSPSFGENPEVLRQQSVELWNRSLPPHPPFSVQLQAYVCQMSKAEKGEYES